MCKSIPDVAADGDAEITADGARGTVGRVGLAQHNAASLDDVGALPDHAHHGARGHVADQTGEEGLAGEVSCSDKKKHEFKISLNLENKAGVW